MKTITYPEIYSSENVIRILSKKPQLPQAPIEPVKPIMPSDPGEYDSGGNRGCSLFVVTQVSDLDFKPFEHTL